MGMVNGMPFIQHFSSPHEHSESFTDSGHSLPSTQRTTYRTVYGQFAQPVALTTRTLTNEHSGSVAF